MQDLHKGFSRCAFSNVRCRLNPTLTVVDRTTGRPESRYLGCVFVDVQEYGEKASRVVSDKVKEGIFSPLQHTGAHF